MSFVKFTAGERGLAPQVTLSPRGILSLNDPAVQKFNLQEWLYSALYYDPDRQTIALERLQDRRHEGVHRMRHIRCQGRDLDARAFLHHFKLRVKKSLSFRLHQDPDTGWLFFRLDEAALTSVPPVPARPDHEAAEKLAAESLAQSKARMAVPRDHGGQRSGGAPLPQAGQDRMVVETGSRPRGGVRAMLSELLHD